MANQGPYWYRLWHSFTFQDHYGAKLRPAVYKSQPILSPIFSICTCDPQILNSPAHLVNTYLSFKSPARTLLWVSQAFTSWKSLRC